MIELDPPGRGKVLVQIAAAGLCHSDLSVINGDHTRPLPMTLGHEAAGMVEGSGVGGDDIAIGDYVVMVFTPKGGHCLPCAEGRPVLCEPGAVANGAGTLLGGATRLYDVDGAIHHRLGWSAFASHAVLSPRSLVRIEPVPPLGEVPPFGCAVRPPSMLW
jgi:alcohol dehydrogenase